MLQPYYSMIKVKVSKCYRKRTTDQNDAKFVGNIVEQRGKLMVQEKNNSKF